MKPALAIFVKTPGFSPVKTRLAATLGTAEALQFHSLACAATAAVAQHCPSLTPYWAIAEGDPQARLAWSGFDQVWQGGGDLGMRLDHVYAELQARHGRVLLIGADAPQLTPDLLESALVALDNAANSFVFGPASDGGFWLFGGRQPIPSDVWRSVHYSQSNTGTQLFDALVTSGHIATLPELTDVDVASDLPALIEAMGALPNPLTAQRELATWLHTLLDHRLSTPTQA